MAAMAVRGAMATPTARVRSARAVTAAMAAWAAMVALEAAALEGTPMLFIGR
jgi:cell wall-associated NlpC family hydrolase